MRIYADAEPWKIGVPYDFDELRRMLKGLGGVHPPEERHTPHLDAPSLAQG